MSLESFSEWLRRQGHRVVRTESSSWFDRFPHVYQAFPWHRLVEPSPGEIEDFLRRERAAGARYCAPDGSPGAARHHMVMETGRGYDLQTLSKTTRKKVRRALDACRVEPISLDRYADEGWLVELDTEQRQGRTSRGGQQAWQRMVKAATDLEGFEVWGALVGDRLAASLMMVQIEDCATILYQQFHRDFSDLMVNYALTFSVAQMVDRRDGVRLIHYGLHGLDSASTLDDFKAKMGYTARPVRERVAFHPYVAPFMNRWSHALLRRARDLWKTNPVLSKGEGLLRLHLEGTDPAFAPPAPAPDAPGPDPE